MNEWMKVGYAPAGRHARERSGSPTRAGELALDGPLEQSTARQVWVVVTQT